MQGVRTAFVTATAPLTVTLAGSAAAVPALTLASYTPVVADRVAVAALDSTKMLILGKVQ